MIWLVNLSKPFTYSQTDTYQSDITFLDKYAIPYIDCMFYELSHQWKLEAFHDAVRNPDIDTIWFISWWIDLCTYLHEIDWDLVKTHKKRYIWLSDFTNFAVLATQYGIECYYGLQLQKIQKRYPEQASQDRIADFLLHNTHEKWSKYPIIGGYLLNTFILLAKNPILLWNQTLFIEYHYIPWETLYNLDYRIYNLLYVIHNNLPKEIILGRTFLYDEQWNLMDIEVINEHIKMRLAHLQIPIRYVDHTKHVIKMG